MNDNLPPLISVITVCYNAEKLIEQTLHSVVSQQYNSVEYIVIDGKSTDNTCRIIEPFKNRISYFISEKDTGIYHAMNKGVKAARGEWIIFMNAGDTFFEVNTLDKVAPYLEIPDYDIVYGNVVRKDKKGDLVQKNASDPVNMHRMFFCHQSSFCRRELLIQIPFDEKYKLSSDFKFVKSSYLKGFKFKYIELPIAVFDLTGASNTRRNEGLWENICIIREVDNFKEQVRLLPRLYFVVLWNFIKAVLS